MLDLLLLFNMCIESFSEEQQHCVDYNGTKVDMDKSYFESPCIECQCLGMEDGKYISSCFEIAYHCPCDTPCCIIHCVNPHENTRNPVDPSEVIALNSNFTIVISVSAATVVIVLGLLLYLYRRRMTRYARITRRLYMERQQSQPKPSSLEAPPPSYDDIQTDSRHHTKLPPRYEDIIPTSFSFAAMQLHDITDSLRTQGESSSATPTNVAD